MNLGLVVVDLMTDIVKINTHFESKVVVNMSRNEKGIEINSMP